MNTSTIDNGRIRVGGGFRLPVSGNAAPTGGCRMPAITLGGGFRLPKVILGGGFRLPKVVLGGGFRLPAAR